MKRGHSKPHSCLIGWWKLTGGVGVNSNLIKWCVCCLHPIGDQHGFTYSQQWRHTAADTVFHRCCCKFVSAAAAAAYLQLFEKLQPVSAETDGSLCRTSPGGDTNHAADLWPPLGVFCTALLCLVEFLSLWESCISLELRQAGKLSLDACFWQFDVEITACLSGKLPEKRFNY